MQNIRYLEDVMVSYEVKRAQEIIIAIIKIEGTDEIEIKRKYIEECIYRLNRELPYYKRIGKIQFVNSLKKTNTGKIIRRTYDERVCESTNQKF